MNSTAPGFSATPASMNNRWVMSPRAPPTHPSILCGRSGQGRASGHHRVLSWGLWLSRFGSGGSLSRESLPIVPFTHATELTAQHAFSATSWLLPGSGATAGECSCSPTGCRTGCDGAAVVVAVSVRIPRCFAVER